MKKTYSVVVPMYNEAGNVKPLFEEIKKTMEEIGEAYEIIFVNDGSSDATLSEMNGLSPLKVINLRKNFGQTASLDAGFKEAQGDFFITLDGDGQNPPSEIPKLISRMKEGGYDLVSGWRKKRKDPFLKRFVSRGAYVLRGFLVKDKVKDSGCSLKIYKRECFEGLDLHGEMHRFIPAILHWRGFRIGEVAVEHKPRVHGTSKYNWKRTVKGFIDMISVWFWRKYSSRPLHLFGGLGLLLFNSGVFLLLILFVLRLAIGYSLSDRIWPLVAVLLVFMGVQFFVSGILADVLVKNHFSETNRPYSVKEVIDQV